MKIRLLLSMPVFDYNRAGAASAVAEIHAIATRRTGNMPDAGGNIITRRADAEWIECVASAFLQYICDKGHYHI